jgi:hypothetical protein
MTDNPLPELPEPRHKCNGSGWRPNYVNGERVWLPLMNDALPCECGELARKYQLEKAAASAIRKA